MTSQYRHRRSSVPSTAFPATIEPGEIAVNTANRQIAVGDAASATLGQPVPLLGARIFDARAMYVINDLMVNNGVLYRCNTPNGPGAFNPAQWDALTGAGAGFVARAGDTMTGNLNLPSLGLNGTAAPQIILTPSSGATKNAQIYQQADTLVIGAAGVGTYAAMNLTNGNMAFNGTLTAGASGATGTYYFGSSGSKYLGYDGTQFNLTGGQLACNSNIYAAGSVYSAPTATTGYYQFGNSSTKYLQYDGANFSLNGGTLFTSAGIVTAGDILATGNLRLAPNATTGTLFFGTSGTKYLQYDGTNFALTGGSLYLNNPDLIVGQGGGTGRVLFGNTGTKYLNYDGTNFNLVGGFIQLGAGFFGRAGQSGASDNTPINFNWVAPGYLHAWIGAVDVGVVTITSDYRIKKDVIDLPGMWDTVKALRPIKYTQAQFSPPSHIKYVAQQAFDARKDAEENPDAAPREINTAPLFEADDIERWGFIAHELQATLTPSASTGEKDSPDTIQSPNPFTVIAALTKALQEAMARIEALEAAA